MLRAALAAVVIVFPVSEVVLAIARPSRRGGARSEDRGSWLALWLAIALGVGLAIAARPTRWAGLPGPRDPWRLLALALLVSGLALRWTAILTLGRLFTVDVAIHSGHAVVQTGLYRVVRHPSYSGMLLAFLGLGFFFANWLSIVALLVPVTLAVANRVRTEERALADALGAPYADYCARTKRFVPGLV